MKRALLSFVGAGLLSGAIGLAQPPVPEQVNRLELEGRFREAARALTNAMLPGLSLQQSKTLEFEADRLERIKKDFPYSEAQLFALLQKSVKALTKEEFELWLAEGRFDSRQIDGQRRFMAESVSNLFFRHPDLYARHIPPVDNSKSERLRWETCAAIKQAALTERKPYVLPKRFDVVMRVTADSSAAPAGETIRAWLPVPREYPFQNDFKFISSFPELKHLDDSRSEIRSAYFEEPVSQSNPSEFRIEYAYTIHGVWFDINPAAVHPCDTNSPALDAYTREAPNVLFTPQMRALSKQIAGNQTNPAVVAKAFYDWIATHIQYSYALEYSTIRNISEYCRSHGYGDCGQEALLFITLCRLNGIPARWQSGWNTFPGEKTIHDWTEIYLAPYGWVPVDPYMGIYATQYATTLTPEQRKDIRDFYFGGLDQYRMIANGDHNQTLNPPKRTLRSDNVDFQRGELEWDNHNIYFDHYSYELEVKEMELPKGLE